MRSMMFAACAVSHAGADGTTLPAQMKASAQQPQTKRNRSCRALEHSQKPNGSCWQNRKEERKKQ